jgi:hypothetical protein
MLGFIVVYLIGYVVAFLLRSIVEFVHNGKYTLRDVFMGLLVACTSFFYVGLCFVGWAGAYIAKLIFIIDEFVINKDMHADKILITKTDIVKVIKKVFRKRK